MGCGACNNRVYTAEGTRAEFVSRLLGELQPHTLLGTDDMSEVAKMMQTESSSDIRIDPAHPLFPLPQQQLRKWKVLTLGRNYDFCKHPPTAHMEKKHKCIGQIMLDIKRTYPGRLSAEHCQCLSNVLIRLAAFFPHVGYTQGMNYIVGFLVLCGFDQQTTLWMAVSLMAGRKYLMLGMFQDDFPLVQLYMAIFHQRLLELDPVLAQHIEKSAIPLEAWLFQWLLTGFLYSLEAEQAVLIWDFIIQRNGLSVVNVALSMIMGLSNELLAIQPGYKILGVLRADSLGSRIDLQRTLARAAQISIDISTLDLTKLSEKSKCYYKVLRSKHKDSAAYEDYRKAIEKSREDYYLTLATST